MKKIYSNNKSKGFNILILNLFLILFFCFEFVQSQNLPFYSHQGGDSIKSKTEKTDKQEKEKIELLSVPERYKSHPEYGKTKLVNPDKHGSYELIQERTVDSRLFQNLDGSFTAVKSGNPLHYKDADGWWRTIDVSFNEDAVKPNFYHLNKQRLPISYDGKTSVVTMQLDSINSMNYGKELSFIQIDNNGNIISNKSINSFVAAVDLNKPKANISNAFDGVDMSFVFDSWMVKTNYIISSSSVINNNAEWVIFREKVNVPENWLIEYDKDNGVLLDGNWHGDLVIKNTGGEVMSKFQMPIYFDSGNDRNTNNINGSYKIEKIDNSTYYLYLMVPASWLKSPERVYPVTLDPPAINDDPTVIASCFSPAYQSSNLSVAVAAGNIITNTYLLWEFTAVNNGAWMQDQISYVSGISGSTSVFYGSGATAGMEQYSLNSTIGNTTSTGAANYTFYASRTYGGTACDNVYNYLNRRYIEVTYGVWGCNNYGNFHSNVNGTGYAPCGSYAVATTIGPGQYQNHYAYLGSSYTINTCGTYYSATPNFDTQISAFQGGSAVLYYNDDNGSICSSNGFSNCHAFDSWVDWTSSINGWVQIQVTKFSCQSWAAGATSAILRVMENPPATPDMPTLTPAGGTYCSGAYVYIDAVGNPPTGITWFWETTPTGTSTINGGPTYVVTTTGTYYLRPRSSSGCWGTASAGVTTTFYPGISNNTISGNQTICSGSSPSAIIGSSPSGGLGAGTYSYGWEISTDGGFTWNYAPVPNTGINYSPSGLTTTTYYQRWVLSGPCDANASNIVVVTVQPVIDPGTISNNQNICYNTVPAGLTGSPPSGGTGAYGYQWQQQPSCSGGWSDIAGANAFNYNFSSSLTQTTCYRRRVSSGVCPDVYSNTVTIGVYGDLAPGSIIDNQFICYNTPPAAFNEASAPSGGTGSYTFQWQLQAGCSGGWADVSGATSNGLNYGANLTQTTCFRRRVISGICNPVYSNTIAINVYSDVTPGTIASNQSICFNTSPATINNVSLPSGGTGTYAYQWQQQLLCSGGWGDIAGATASNYSSAVNLIQTTCFRRRVINACGTVFSNTITVTVYAQLTGGSVGWDQTIPYNTAPSSFVNLSLPNGGTGAITYQWQIQVGCSGGWADIGGATASTCNYPTSLTQNTCFRRVATNTCGSVLSNTISIYVQGAVTGGAIGNDQTICYNSTPSQFINVASPSGGSGSYTYQWEIQPGCSGPWSDIVGATGNVYTHSTPLTQNTCFRRRATSSGQTAYSNTVTVIIFANLTSGTVGNDQTICYNTTPLWFSQITAPSGGTGSYTYQWQSQPGCSGGWGDIAGATASTYQTGSLTTTTCYRRNVTYGSCGTIATNTITVSVYAILTSGSVASDQSLCYNTSPAAFTETIAPSGGTGSYTYQWLIQPGCTGFYNFIPGAISSTYDEPGNLTQTTCYRRTVTSGGCGQATTNTITVTVYGDLTSGSVAANQIICYNTTPAQFSSTANPGGGTGSYTYQWQIQPGCSGGWSDISGALSNIYSHPTPLIQTTCFRRNVTSGSCGTVSSNSITVTVYANLTSGSVGSDQVLCYNTSPIAFTQTAAASGGNGSFTYQWQSQPGCSGGWGDIAGATASTYDEPANLIQTTCYRRNVTSGSCGTVSSNTITVTVYADLTSGSVGSDQTLCFNTSPAAFTQVSPSGGNGVYIYQWQIQPGCSGGWSDIGGAIVSTYHEMGNLTQTTCYRRNVTSGSCGTVATNTITVTVYANLTSGSVAADQTICYNNIPATFTNTVSPSGGTGSYTYQWQIQPLCMAGWSDIAGATSNIYSSPALTNTSCFRRKVTSGACGTLSSNTIMVTVYGNLTSGSVASDQTICYNTIPAAFTQTIVPSGGNGSYTYQWQSQPGCSGGWGDIAGATAPVYQAGNLTQTTCYRRNVTSVSCGTVATNTITVVVYANLTSGSVGSDQSLCYNTSPAAFVQTIAATGGTGFYTYQWQIQPGCSGVWTDIAGATASTYDEPGNLVQTTCYRRNVTSGSCGTVPTNTITVTVYGDLTGGVVNASQTICYNQNIAGFNNITSPTGGNGFYNYQWQIQPGCSGPWNNIPGATSNIYSHPSVLFQTTCFRRQVTNICGIVYSNTLTITVNPLPVVSFTGLAGPYCISQTTPVPLTGSPSGGLFIGNGISGNNFIPYYAAVGSNTITYTYTDGNVCTNSTSQSVIVIGLPTVDFSGLAGPYCINDNNPVSLTGYPSGGVFSGSGISGNTFIPSLAGVGVHTITYTYADANGCTNSKSYTAVVNALPAVTFSGLQAHYCINTSPSTLIGFPAGGIFSGAGITGNIFNPTTAGPGLHIITYTYTDAIGCVNSTQQTTNVHNLPVVSFSGLAANYCFEASSALLTGSPSGGIFSGTGISSSYFYPGISGQGTFNITYTYTDGFSCINSSTQSTTVYGQLVPGAVGNNQTICYNTPPATFVNIAPSSGGAPGTTYQWQQQPGCIGNWSNIAGAVATTCNFGGNLIQTACFRRLVFNTCGNLISNTVEVYVYGDLTSGSIAADQTICNNTSPAAFTQTTAPTGGNGTYSYQWQEQPGCIGVWSDIAGATASTYDVPGNITQTTCYRRKVVSGASCGTVYTNTITVTVYGNLTSGSIAADQTICYNTTAATFTNTISPTGGTGLYAYQWQIQPGCSGPWTDIAGATSDVYTQNTPFILTTCFRRKVTSGSCGTVFSNVITVTVFADFTPGAVATDQTICYNTSPAAFTQTIAPTGGNNTYAYQWQSQPGCTGIWSNIAGAIASTYDVPGNITQTTCYKRLVTSGTCGTLSTNIITVTVYPDLAPGTVGYNQSICYDSIADPFLNIAVATGGSGVYNYQWQIQPGCSGGWSNIIGATSTTYAHPTSLIQSTCFRRVVTNVCGILNSNTITVTVFNYTPVSFTGLQAQYCTDAAPVLLTGTPSGGTFSGSGITGNHFYPNIAGSGLHVITYTYIDPNGCTNFQTQQVTVYDIPIVSFTGLLSNYCVDAVPATLTGSPGGGVFSGTGITGNIFNPSVAGPGTYTITYTYIDGHTCTNSSTQTVTVHALPMVGLLGLSNSYCIDNSPVNLTGLPFGGTFTGAGMSLNVFNPATAGVGTHFITYTYTDIYGCTNHNTQMTDVYALPVVSFTGLQSPYCTYSSPEVLTGTPNGGTFTGPGIVGNTFYPNIAGVGTFNIVYSYTDGNSCLNHDTQTVVVNLQPIVSFSGLNTAYCIDAPTVTLVGSPPGGVFSGAGINGNDFNPSVAGAGVHGITYSYTSSTGCHANITHNVIVNALPVVFFSGLSAEYCVDASLATLNGSPSGGYFTGPGMMGNIFNPGIAGAGTHTIIYHYTDGNFCTNTYSQTVIVHALPIVTFNGLAPHYCPYEVGLLQGVPSGGTFTGPGMVNNLFYASISGVGTHHIVYTYIDGNNCLNTDTQITVVSALVPVNIIGLASNYCIDDLPAPLTGNPIGGTFTGPGMYGNLFYPDSAGVGTHTIIYSSTDSLGCINDIQENTVVHGLPLVDFYGLDSAYCVDGLPSQLFGIPSSGTFSGSGINGNYFYPNLAIVGIDSITYTYTDNFTCVNSKSRAVIVNSLPIVHITNLQPSYCYNNPPIALSGTPAGGTFSGTGVLGGYFYPVVSGVGTFNVTYTYSDSNSCVNFHTQAVQILPVPAITSTDTVFTCSGQSVSYNITSSLAGTTYTWTSALILGSATGYSAGSGSSINDTLINNTLSAALVKYVITPTSASTPACTGNSFILIVNVRPYPTLFAGNDAQICSNTPYTVMDATTDPTNIIHWTTNGLGTFNSSSLMHPTYTPSTSEFGNISLYMTVTNLLGCPKTDTMVLIIDYAPIANAGGNHVIICGGSVALGSAFHPNYIYNWTPITGLSNPNIAQPTASPMTNTTYILTVTDTINGCFDIDSAVIMINGAPYANAGPDTSINCGGTGLTIGSLVVNGMIYSWSPALGLDNPNIPQPFATPLSNTTYTVTVTDQVTSCYSTDQITITVIGAPTANAGPDQSVICGNSAGVVIGSPGNSNLSYNWQPTIGLSNPNIAQPIAHPLSNTTYVLTVTDTATGCFATDNMTITVIGAPTANAGFDQSLNCGSGTGVIIGTPGTSGLSYNWLPSNGLSDPNSPQPTATPLTNTTYHLIVTDLLTGCYATDNMNITAVGAPVANAGIDQSINCGGTGLQIGTPGSLSYSWSPSNTLSNPNIATPIATPLGSTNYTLTVTDLNTGCFNTDNITITVIGAPIASAGLDQSVNCGASIIIGSVAVSNMSYTWIPSLGLNNPNIAMPTATPHTNTNYTLIVTNTNSGCYATDDINITVIDAPIANAGPNQTINCGGPGTVIGTPSVTGMSYTWSPSYALSASNVGQPTATPLGNTTYYLTVTNTSTGCYGVDSVSITVAGAPVANAGVDKTISCGGVGATIGTPGSAGYSYTWSPPTGLSDPNTATPIASPLGNTTYHLTVTDTLTGCFGTDIVNIHVSGTPIANAGLNQAIPCGGPGVLIGTSGSGTVIYTWNPNYGLNNSNIATPIATPYITTNYVITATDSVTGCFATDDVLVTVVGLPSVYAGSDGFVCANDTFMINNATSSNSFVHWTYDGIGNLTNNTTLTPTYFPLPNEFGSVTLTLTAVCNIDTATDNMKLTIYPYPIATFSALDSSYCIDNPGNVLIGYPTGGVFSGSGISGDFFSPGVAGVGIHIITYTYQDPNGCTKDTSLTTIVNPLPVVSFTGLASHYCAYDAAYLTGTPTGGTFSGPGMVDNMFYANISGVGTFNITYAYLDSNGCVNSQTQQTTVTAIPSVNFAGLASQYCIDAPSVILSGTPAGGTFSGPGIVNDTVFDPSIAGAGYHNIDYAFLDVSGCISNATHTVIVYDLPNVTFSGLDTAYCIDAAPVLLSGFIAGGTFSGPGISDSIFNPSVAGSGIHTITYTYTDIHGCTNFYSLNVKVNPLPIVTLSPLNAVCSDVSPFALYGGLPSGGTYTGAGVLNNIFYPATAGVGTFQITYTYTDNLGCTDFAIRPITVNSLPVVSFVGLATYYCIGNDSIVLTGTPSGGIFTGPGITGTIFNPMLAGVGFHSITYTFTDTNSCTAFQTQLVEVKALPIVNFSGLDTAYCIDAPIAQLIGYPGSGTFTGAGISGTTFSPSIAAAGTHLIKYTFIDPYLCTDSTSQNVIVHALPVVTLAPLGDLCPNSPAYILIGGNPLGGIYTGTGVNANIFYPNIAGVGPHNITYTFTDIFSCVNFFMQTLTVNPLPVLTINGLDSLYCYNAPSDTLTGLPAGGYFIGAGISGNAFNPTIAGVGMHDIGYVYTDSSSCTDTLYQSVKVLPLPQLAFSGLDSAYCVNNPADSLYGFPTGGIFFGSGITVNSFDPSIAGVGTHSISYTYTDINICTDTISTNVVVHALPVVTFDTLTSLCVDALPITLNTGLPTGGVYSGPGVSNGQFNPTIAGVGTHTLTYEFSDLNHCVNTATQTITVNPLPIVSFTGLQPYYCANNTADTLTGIPSGGAFSGIGISNNIFNPVIGGVGTHLITYTYTDSNSCTNHYSQNTDVKPLPILSVTGLDTSYCINSSSVYIYGHPAGGTFTGTGVSGNIFNPVVAGIGIYEIVYTYADFYGCTNKDTTIVVVNDLAILSVIPVNPVCIDATPFLLQCVLPAGGTYSGQGVVSDVFYPLLAGAGTHIIYYDYLDNNNCMVSDSTVITVNPLPVVALSLPLYEMCTNDSLLPLTGGTPLGGIYSGAGITGAVFNPYIAGAGGHIITYTFTDTNSCINSAQDFLNVNQAPLADAGEDVAICAKTSAILKATGGDFYVWSDNETVPEIVVTPFQTSTYYVTVNDAFNGCSEIDSVTVSIIPLPVVTLVTDAESNVLTYGQFITFTAVPSTYNYYDFYMNTSLAQSGALGYYATNLVTSDTMITVIALDGNCISEPFNLKLNVKPVSNAFTPNGDGKNDVYMKGYDLSIMNRWGQLLYEGFDGWDGTFNGLEMPEGTYYYIIRFKDLKGNISVSKGSVTLYRTKE